MFEKGEVKHVLRVVEGREARVRVEFEPGVEPCRGTEIGDAARGLFRGGWAGGLGISLFSCDNKEETVCSPRRRLR